MSKTIEEILTPKPEIRPRIYAYSIADEAPGNLRSAECGSNRRQVVDSLSTTEQF